MIKEVRRRNPESGVDKREKEGRIRREKRESGCDRGRKSKRLNWGYEGLRDPGGWSRGRETNRPAFSPGLGSGL